MGKGEKGKGKGEKGQGTGNLLATLLGTPGIGKWELETGNWEFVCDSVGNSWNWEVGTGNWEFVCDSVATIDPPKIVKLTMTLKFQLLKKCMCGRKR